MTVALLGQGGKRLEAVPAGDKHEITSTVNYWKTTLLEEMALGKEKKKCASFSKGGLDGGLEKL